MFIGFIIAEVICIIVYALFYSTQKNINKDILIMKRLLFSLFEMIGFSLMGLMSIILQKYENVILILMGAIFITSSLILYFVELGKTKTKKIYNIISIAFFRAIILFFLLLCCFESELINITSTIMFIISGLGMFLSILDLLKVDKISNENNILKFENEETKNIINTKKLKNEKKLPEGMLNVSWRIALIVAYIIGLIIYIIIVINNLKINVIVFSFFGFLGYVFVASIIFTIIMTKSNMRAFKIFYNDLDYQKLKNTVLSKIEKTNINEETKNHFYMLLMSVAIFYSLNDYYDFKNKIFEPKSNEYKIEYDFAMLNPFDGLEEIEKWEQKIRLKYFDNKIKFVIMNKVDEHALSWKAYYKSDVIENIDVLLPIENQLTFSIATNMFVKIFYYKNIGEIEKSEELKEIFLEKYKCMETLKNIIESQEK